MKGKYKLLICLLAMIMLGIMPLTVNARELNPTKVLGEGYAEVSHYSTKDGSYFGSITRYYYDANRNIIKKVGYNSDGSISSVEEFFYDENGRLIKHIDGYGDYGEYYEVYEYDDAGMKIFYYHNSDITFIREYDLDGHCLRQIMYTEEHPEGLIADNSNSSNDSEEIEYDENGNVIKHIFYSGLWHEYEYDENGNLSKAVICNVGYSTWTYLYEYDESGRPVKELHYLNTSDTGTEPNETCIYEYDVNGDVTKTTSSISSTGNKFESVMKYVKVERLPDDSDKNIYAYYEDYDFSIDADNHITCYDITGAKVINEFKCDGIYTYFFQADGTAMKDRLTYHPDGVHVIYFDQDGHEVFSNFANVKQAISGESVDDFCFFDVYGYLYTDVVTYDQAGEQLYYANPYGVMEHNGWFQFSDTVKCADGTPWEGAAGGYGYANPDGTLLRDTEAVDWLGRPCYLQGNGVALYY